MRIVYLLSLLLVVSLVPCGYVCGEEGANGAQTVVTKTLPNGAVYVGQMKDDKFHGQGALTFPDGAKYKGNFMGGKPNGQGTMDFPDKRKYEGEWKDGVFSGKGTLTFPDGSHYVGAFADEPNGEGVRTYADGSEDKGTFKNGKLYDGQHISELPPDEIEMAPKGTKGKLVIVIKEGKPVEKKRIATSANYDEEAVKKELKAAEEADKLVAEKIEAEKKAAAGTPDPKASQQPKK